TTIYSHLDESNAHDGGLITLGALDTANCRDITWLTLTSKTYWQVTVRKVSLGSFATTGWQQGTPDSGVAYLGIPISLVYPIMQELNATWNFDLDDYQVDCGLRKDGPSITFDIENSTFEVPSTQYIRKFKLESKEICLLSILEQYSVAFVPSWALGYPFLRSYCSVYDFGNARVGFALPMKK
ncbi:unnamed protein product, partial [Thelazia callipaeda]|uniref:Peptidase A1 domain-containing protein n=1 Tax=Thelazia callipaeda TaxID=103827 RepID=A0A0N5CR86_THECL